MPRQKFQTRLPADMAEKVDEFQDEHDISQAEAVRRLIDAGLEVERDDGEILDTRDMAEARYNGTARTALGALIGVMVFLLLLLEVGAL
jgi:hypothetical protein